MTKWKIIHRTTRRGRRCSTRFGTNRQLWNFEQLVDFAAEIGLDQHEARDVLVARRYRAQVEEEQLRAPQSLSMPFGEGDSCERGGACAA
ncbi:MAG TPA: hypothetical protein VI121_13525 [Agromyces sp.]